MKHSPRTYLILQSILGFPLAGLLLFVFLPLKIALPLYLLGSALSVLSTYAGYKALSLPTKMGKEKMIGAEGLVVQAIDPEGLVRIQNELWKATADERIKAGERVVVVELHGLKVIVRRREG